MVFKLDIFEAYNKVSWGFLFKLVLNKFGFKEKVMGLIKECVTTPIFSILVNVISRGFINSGRGLRWGNPLPLYLFILVA